MFGSTSITYCSDLATALQEEWIKIPLATVKDNSQDELMMYWPQK